MFPTEIQSGAPGRHEHRLHPAKRVVGANFRRAAADVGGGEHVQQEGLQRGVPHRSAAVHRRAHAKVQPGGREPGSSVHRLRAFQVLLVRFCLD